MALLLVVQVREATELNYGDIIYLFMTPVVNVKDMKPEEAAIEIQRVIRGKQHRTGSTPKAGEACVCLGRAACGHERCTIAVGADRVWAARGCWGVERGVGRVGGACGRQWAAGCASRQRASQHFSLRIHTGRILQIPD